jgi:hypothetical protein
MILSYVNKRAWAKQERLVCTKTQVNRRKEMGLELEKEEWYAPVETSHESTDSKSHYWQNEI